MYRRLPPTRYVPKNSVKVSDKKSDAVAYLYENSRGKPTMVVYYGKQNSPVFHYSYPTVEKRDAAVAQAFTRRQEALASKAEYTAKRVAENKAARGKVQIGDIFRTSWGYDQTNVEFFEVVDVKGAYCTVREIASASVGGGPGGERCVAQSGAFLEPRFEGDTRGQPLRRLIQSGGIKIDDVRTGWPWGKRVAGVVVGEPAHRTAFGYGH